VFIFLNSILHLMQAARHAGRPRGMSIWTKFVESDSLSCRPTHPRRESCCHIVPIEKILTATNAARRVHTRIATYLGGCERSSFHDSTKFNAFTGFGFLWFYR
jgi:hypothetical protein